MYSYRSKLSKEASYITRNFFMFTYKASADLERAGFGVLRIVNFFHLYMPMLLHWVVSLVIMRIFS